MRKLCFAATALVCLSAPALGADPTGDWLVANQFAVIRITPCGDALCGNIVWTKGPPGTDQHNPDPAKRNRSVIGVPVLLNMKPAGSNRWQGEIYHVQEGKTYSGSIALASANVLRIEGCLMGFLCGGQNWTRAKCEPAPSVPGSARRPPATPSSPSVTSCREVAP